MSARIPVRLGLNKTGTPREQALGRSRGGCSTKIHLLVDGLGNPLRVLLSAGHAHHSPHAPALLDGLTFTRVIADRGSAGPAVVDMLLARGVEVVIPPHPRAKQRRAYDHWWERHVVDWLINTIKPVRRVCSRFDTLADRSRGFVHVTSVLIWLR